MFPGFDQVWDKRAREVGCLRLLYSHKTFGVQKPTDAAELVGVVLQVRNLNS